MSAQKRHAARLANLADLVRDLTRINALGSFAGESEQDGAVGSVPHAGERERTVKLRSDGSGFGETSAGFKTENKLACRAHGAHGVRTGRPYSNLEQLKNAGTHSLAPQFFAKGLLPIVHITLIAFEVHERQPVTGLPPLILRGQIEIGAMRAEKNITGKAAEDAESPLIVGNDPRILLVPAQAISRIPSTARIS